MFDSLGPKAFEVFGAFGFVLVLLLLAIRWLAKELKAARDRVDDLTKCRLDDAKSHLSDTAKLGEAMRITMADNTSAMEANTKVMEAVLDARGGRR